MTANITGCWHVTSHLSSSQENPGGAAAQPLSRAHAEKPPPSQLGICRALQPTSLYSLDVHTA